MKRMAKPGRCIGIAIAGVAALLLLVGCQRPVPPVAPEQVEATRGIYTDRVVVSWAAVPEAATYSIHRADTEGGAYTELGETTELRFEDTDVVPGEVRWYAVTACNVAGCSNPSAPVQGYATDEDIPVPPPPPAP